MKERPILFIGPMVRAILEGRKTQTRRVVKPPKWSDADEIFFIGNDSIAVPDDDHADYFIACPYGKPGDRLWVRETWMADPSCDDDAWDDHHVSWMEWDGCGCRTRDIPTQLCKVENVIHKASWDGIEMVGWKPSIHMPRWASRILLEITAVRVERLQDVSEEDAISEGCYTNDEYCDLGGTESLWPCPSCGGWQVHGAVGSNMGFIEVDCQDCKKAKQRFTHLWQSINGARSWDENPWVWVVEFKALKP